MSGTKVSVKRERDPKLVKVTKEKKVQFLSCIVSIDKYCNSNQTEWSTIQGVIARVISKSDEREARGRFEITSTITP